VLAVGDAAVNTLSKVLLAADISNTISYSNIALTATFPVPVSVEAKLSFVEPGRRWAHSPSRSKTPGISYQGTMKTSVRMLKTAGGL